jgi:hypothetical protein
MLRLFIAIFLISVVEGDCWKKIIVNPERSYGIKNEGKLQKPEDILGIGGSSNHSILDFSMSSVR